MFAPSGSCSVGSRRFATDLEPCDEQFSNRQPLSPSSRAAKVVTVVEPDRAERLTIEQIIETGLRLTRQHGLTNFTMRTLAEELGVSPMATYYYVTNKQALVELLVDAVLAKISDPDPSVGTWSERLWLLNRSARKALAAHPGLADELLARPPTEHGQRLIDASVAMLREAGFDESEAWQAYVTFEACMFGRAVIARSHRAPVSNDKAYRWSFDTLVAGFEARIMSRRFARP